jgi:hypothetical protein
MVEAPNFPERMTKTAQVLSSLNENFFDFFDFAVKKFCESSLGRTPALTSFTRYWR